MTIRWMCFASLLAACSGGPGGPGDDFEGDFGQHDLLTLAEDCEGVAGLTGQSVLDGRTNEIAAQLSYVTATGARVDPTAMTVGLTWPATPVATCYPAHSVSGTVIAQPRVAIEGLTLRFRTADGKFDETLGAKAWRLQLGGGFQGPLLLAVTLRPLLHGTWQPFPEYDSPSNTTVSFTTGLIGESSSQASGNVGLGSEVPEELNAAILRGRFAVATWP